MLKKPHKKFQDKTNMFLYKVRGHKNLKFTMALLSAMVFFGALLLLGMEPLVGRLLTPYFGGAAHVWLICLMFFQGILFLGYLYSHLVARRIGAWHLLLLFLPLINLPLNIQAEADPHAPLLQIISILLIHVALPFFILSTTAVVAQYWHARSFLGEHFEPYPLYAASNAGSLIALLGYTFLAEPLTGLKSQSLIWSWGYVLYMLLVILVWFKLRPSKGVETSISAIAKGDSGKILTVSLCVRWLILSSLASALLLAVTNYIALEIGSFPLIWVAPLALYLATFIIAFRSGSGVPKILKTIWTEILLSALFLYLVGPSYWLAIVGHLFIFFLICLVAHGTLYELRPPASHLTHFYLIIAFGGWIGGAFVSLLVPYMFKGLFEYPLLLLSLGIVFAWCHTGALSILQRSKHFSMKIVRVVFVVGILSAIAMETWAAIKEPVVFRHRNLYGTYRIKDDPSAGGEFGMVRKILHGRTLHGAQFLDPSIRLTPLSYYYIGGGISEVYLTTSNPRKIAVLGLGSGAVAAYAKHGDTITYYEIDPDNEWIARRWFTYLNETPSDLNVIVGDGRLSMRKAALDNKKYDIIHMDAFTGGGIPTHLLTKEAIEIYLNCLEKDGAILFHVSNRYYELRPVILSTAKLLNLFAVYNVPATSDKLKVYENAAWCVVLASNPERLIPLLRLGWLVLEKNGEFGEVLPWTDDYINILAPLIENIKQNIRQ